MSINSFTETQVYDWKKVFFKNVNSDNVDCLTLNGEPIPVVGFDNNPANIIYRPGSTPAVDSNIVNSWADVVIKANKINVTQCLNVFFDDSIVSPCIVDSSLDCQGRVTLQPYRASASTNVQVKVNDGAVITNPKAFLGSMTIRLDSRTGPCLLLNNGSIDVNFAGAQIGLASTATVPGILIQGSAVLGCGLGSQLSNDDTGNLVSLISVDVGAELIVSDVINSSGSQFRPNLISSVDNTSNLFVIYDCSVDISTLTSATTAFTGTKGSQNIDKAQFLDYNDSVVPMSGSSNVQGCLDWLKTQIGGGSGTPTDIIFRAGATSSDNLYGTWAEILSTCDSSNQFVNVCVDSSDADCVANVSHDFLGRTSFYSKSGGFVPNSTLKIQNGVLLKNIRQIGGPLTLLGINTGGGPSLTFDGGSVFFINDSASLDVDPSNTGPMIDISSGQEVDIQLSNYGFFISRSLPYVNIGIGSTLGLTLFNGSSIDSNSITSTDASGVLNVYSDASSNLLFPQTGYLGTPNIQLADVSSYVSYQNNVLISPINLNATDTQTAIDSLKNMTKSVIYRPGIAQSSRNILKTFAEVVSLASKNNNVLDVYFDDSVFSPCPIDVSYDFGGGVTFNSFNNRAISSTYAQIALGTQIKNLKGIYGMLTVTSDNADGNPTLLWDDGKFFEMSYATLDNTAGSTGPYINVPVSLQFSILNRANLSASGGHPIAVSVAPSAQLFMSSVVACQIQSNCISGGVSATVSIVGDASQNPQSQSTSFLGTINTNNIDKAEFVSYNDIYQNPQLNATTVQQAIDALKTNTPTTKPAFNVSTQTKSNVTGDGTQYTVLFDVIDHDPNVMYNALTGECTISTTGTYIVTSNVIVGNISVTQTEGSYKLVDQGGTIHELTEFNPYPIGFNSPGLNVNMRFSKVVYLTNGTKLHCELTVSGGTPTVNINVGAVADRYCYFSASLL